MKRGAEDDLQKDTFDQNGYPKTPNSQEPVSRASQGTMSSRKIASVRRSRYPGAKRPLTSGSKPSSNQSDPSNQSNPFSVLPQQTFGTTNGFVFGAASQATIQGTQFNFSNSNTTNPFANANGNSNQGQASQDQASIQSEDIMMESPQKKRATGSIFASDNGSSFPPFGQSIPNTAFSGFSQPSANTGALFSNPATSTLGSVFDQTTQPPAATQFGTNISSQTTGIFGAPSASSMPPQAASFTFGQTSSQPNASNGNSQPQSQSSSFSFGQTQNATQNKPSAGFTFGQTSSTAQNTAISQPSVAPPSFGSISAPPTTTPADSNGFFFIDKGNAPGGSRPSSPFAAGFTPKPAANPAAPEPAQAMITPKPTFSFGKTTSQTPLFGGVTAQEPSQRTPSVTPFQPSQRPLDLGNSILKTKKAKLLDNDERDAASETPNSIKTNTPGIHSFQSYPPGLAMGSPGSNLFSQPLSADSPSISTTFSPSSFSPIGGHTSLFENIQSTPKTSSTSNLFSRLTRSDEVSTSNSPGFKSPFKLGDNARQPPDSAAEVSDPRKRKQPSKTTEAPKNDGVISNTSPVSERPFNWADPLNLKQNSSTLQTPKNDRSMSQPEASSTATPVASSQSQGVATPATTLKFGSNIGLTSTSQPTSSAASTKHSLASSTSLASETTPKPRTTQQSNVPAFTKPAARPLSPVQPTATSVGLWQHPLSPTSSPPPHIKTRSNGSSIFNTDFTPSEHVGFNKSYRLRSLDREFQHQISVIDIRVHDLAPLIKYYVEMRGSIGEAIGGLYTRSLAGTKRKADDPHGQHEDSSGPSKRSRSEVTSDAIRSDSSLSLPAQQIQSAPESNTSSLFTKTISPPQGKAINEAPAVPASAPAKTTFSSNIFAAAPVTEATATSTPKPPSSLFASTNSFSALTPTSSMVAGEGSVERVNVASSSKSQSTTPAKSPPKKPMGGMPVFQPSLASSNFAAFKAGAEKTARQERAKRKAEEYDSDEETEEEYSDRAKKARLEKDAKIDAIPKLGFKPTFGSANRANDGEKTPVQSAKPSLATPHNSSENSSFFATSSLFGSSGRPIQQPLEIASSDDDSDGEGLFVEEDEDHKYTGDADQNENYDAYDDRASDPNEDYDAYDDHTSSGDDNGDDYLQPEEDDSANASQNGRDPDQQYAAKLNKGKSLFDRIERPSSPEAAQPTEEDFEAHDELSESKDSPTSPPDYREDSPIRQEPLNNSFKPGLFGAHLAQDTPKAPVASPFTPLNDIQGSPMRQEPLNNSFKPSLFGSNLAQNTPKAPVASAFTPLNGTPGFSRASEPSSLFSFTPRVATPTPQQASSVLFGAPTRDGPIRGEGLFGSRPSTPIQDDQTPKPSQTPFGTVGKSGFLTPGDHTWKMGSPIKFGTSEPNDKGPTVNITAATPPAKENDQPTRPFSSLFGSSSSAAKSISPFGAASKPANGLGFGFTPLSGHLTASSHLTPAVDDSGRSSRASTPGLTDNESVATNDTDDAAPNDPQTSLMSAQDGNEDEELLVEIRAKGCKWEKGSTDAVMKEEGYRGQGVGPFKLYRNKTTGKTRMLLRSEPRGNITINANLMSNMIYNAEGTKSGAMRFGIQLPDGKTMERWMLKFKTRADADKVSKIMEENKRG